MLRTCLTLALATLLTFPAQAKRPDGGHGVTHEDFSDHVTPALNKRLAEEASANIAQLRAEGRLSVLQPKASGLTWPLGPVDGAGTDLHGISNFVDLNPAFPNQVRDYTCASRSYDTAGGYNHRGIDYFTWPFAWHLMDQGTVDVRAVAAGTLVARGDGNNDRSCSFNAPDTPNYVVIRHADGTVARYLHFKLGSVTTKPIGAAI
ncbi:MAG TPA: M23 family metallopeptidase, partial [Arenimonas sp.]|nr:M23 family metallopeptidase [Arenimonas sp.]